MSMEPYNYLPTFAKKAIEDLDSDADKRNHFMLDMLLDAYAKTYSAPVADEQLRRSTHYICKRRFPDFIAGRTA